MRPAPARSPATHDADGPAALSSGGGRSLELEVRESRGPGELAFGLRAPESLGWSGTVDCTTHLATPHGAIVATHTHATLSVDATSPTVGPEVTLAVPTDGFFVLGLSCDLTDSHGSVPHRSYSYVERSNDVVRRVSAATFYARSSANEGVVL